MKIVDLNADLAEGMPNDQALLAKISSANISCGLHAGDAQTMQKALRWAKQYGVVIGAHPSFPDRENFGRTSMQLSDEELEAHLLYQLGALQALCDAEGVTMRYVKPHGALYNQAAKDPKLAQLIVKTLQKFPRPLALMGLSGSHLIFEAEKAGLATLSEVFADRHYQADGSLVPRNQANAQIKNDEEAIAQVLQMVTTGTATSIDGTEISVKADSICLHGDGKHALQFVEQIRQALLAQGIQIQSPLT